MTDTDHDHHFDERLRRLSRALDDATPPVSSDEARSRPAGRRRPRWVAPALAAAACVVLAGLAGVTLTQPTGDTSVVAGPSGRPSSDTATPLTTLVPTTTPSTLVVPTTTPSTILVPTPTPSTMLAPTTTAPASAAPLPGERIEIYPYEGARLAVVGVAADDKLNVRVGPGTDYPVAFTLEPLANGIRATGHNRTVGEGIWAQVEAGGRSGWARAGFLMEPGLVQDLTARWYPSPAEHPSAMTMTALAQEVERRWRQESIGSGGSDEPGKRVVVVDGPHSGDLAEITLDVLGLRDDALGGVRLHIFAEPAAGRFTLRTVEVTELCLRGVTNGMCA